MPIFQPPSADLVPPDSYEPMDPLSHRLARHMKARARGMSVLKIGGAYQTVVAPTQDQVDAASEVYLGGHVYAVSVSVAAALEAAGYSTS